MKLYAPKYYEDFKCIADKCRHSCCIGWEIGVDEETLRRCESLPEDEREEILSKVEDGVIRLTEDKRCPFLDCMGLCKIISFHGEEYTSQICREHPRFYNFLPDRVEVGLGASCEEAARIILSSEEYDVILPIGEADGEAEEGYDPTPERERIYSVLGDGELSYEGKLSKIMKSYALAEGLFASDRLSALFSELEYLREEDRERFCSVTVREREENGVFGERFFAYLVYRHLSAAESFDALRARLCLCFSLLRLFESVR